MSFSSCNFPHFYNTNFLKKMQGKKTVLFLKISSWEKIQFFVPNLRKIAKTLGKNDNFEIVVFFSLRQKLLFFFLSIKTVILFSFRFWIFFPFFGKDIIILFSLRFSDIVILLSC